MVLYVEQRSTKFFPLCNLSHSIGYMSQTGLCCFRHPSSCSTPRCLFLLVSLVIAPCSTCFLVQSLEKWLMGVQWVQCVCVCLCAGVFWCVRVKVHIFMFLKVCARVCVYVPERMHRNVTGLCNWNGNEPISDCNGVPPCPAFTSEFKLPQTLFFYFVFVCP